MPADSRSLFARNTRTFQTGEHSSSKRTLDWKSTLTGAAIVGEDLRHEVTHAYLHSVLPNIPLWLDEGLAEYFEVPRGRHGLNRDHLARILEKDGPKEPLASVPLESPGEMLYRPPNLARLESLSADHFLPQEDYAECWAWVHFLLESGPDTKLLLQEYLYRLHVDGATVPLSSRLAWQLGLTADQLADRMAEHVLETARAAALAESTDAGTSEEAP